MAPSRAPGLMPPPAIQRVKQCGWWSRPRKVEPPRASFIDVRPNSPPQTTSVSSSRPALLEVLQQGGDRPVDLPGTSRAGARRCRRRRRCRGSPSPSRRAGRTARRARPGGGRAGSCWRTRPRPARRRSRCGRVSGSLLMSMTSGTDICMRKASSYWLIRVSVSGSPNCCELMLVELPEGVERSAAGGAVHALRVADVEDRVAGGAALHALVDRGQEAGATRAPCRRWGRCRRRSARRSRAGWRSRSRGRR